MERPLSGRIILVIEDEPLIALDIEQGLEAAGATTISARTVSAALLAIEEPNLSAAIVDHALGDGDSSVLCHRLTERDIPFVTYTGYGDIEGACSAGAHVAKPANTSVLVSTVASLLAKRVIAN